MPSSASLQSPSINNHCSPTEIRCAGLIGGSRLAFINYFRETLVEFIIIREKGRLWSSRLER
jgi:hypothetical protein